MAPSANGINNWLLGPGLNQFFRVDRDDHAVEETNDYSSTKEILKEQLVDSFLESALQQLDETPASLPAANKTEEKAFYIYAVIPEKKKLDLPPLGIDGAHPIFHFPHGQLQALVSEVPVSRFGEEALQTKLQDKAWVDKTLRLHNQVLSIIQPQSMMVPMRMCTLCHSKEALKTFLEENHTDFSTTLGIIAGQQEWTVSVLARPRRLRHLTAQASNKVRAMQAEIAQKPPEEANLLQVEMETLIVEEVQTVCRACVKHVSSSLTPLATDAAVVTTDDSMAGELLTIFSCVFLVGAPSEAAFSTKARELMKAYQSLGFDIVISGPDAPARFAKSPSSLAAMLAAPASEQIN